MGSSKDYFKLHFIVFLWGFSAILGKLITGPVIELVGYRSVLASAGMAAVIYFSRTSFKVSRADLYRLLGIGAIVSVHWISFFGSARVANVSVCLVGFATNSLWTAIIEPWSKKERVKKYELLLGLMVIFGLYIIFSFDFQYKLGLLLAVLAGLTSAVFSVLNARMVRRISASTITFYEMVGVAIFTALVFLLFGDAPLPYTPSATDFLYIAILAGACSVYAYTVGVELMRRISVFMIQLTLNLEPLYGIVMAVIIFGEEEKMNANFYVGTLIILAAVVLYPFLKKNYE